jgi:hypothetical protein
MIALITVADVEYVEGINTFKLFNVGNGFAIFIKIKKYINGAFQDINEITLQDEEEIFYTLKDGYYVFEVINIAEFTSYLLTENIKLCFKNLILKILCETINCEKAVNFNSFVLLYSNLNEYVKDTDIIFINALSIIENLNVNTIEQIDFIIDRLLYYCETLNNNCGCNDK